jgi:hypothetical protein
VRDVVLFALLTVGFAAWCTAHVALAGRLVLRTKPRWRGLAALVVPPLALIWGLRAGFRRNAAVWSAALVVYAVCLVISKVGR